MVRIERAIIMTGLRRSGRSALDRINNDHLHQCLQV